MDKELNYELDLLQNITWQYDLAVNLVGLSQAKQDWYDKEWKGFWAGWESSVFNLRTANLFGIVVWALILDVPVSLVYGSVVTDARPFGFANRSNFDTANFYGSSAASALQLEEARKLLRIRYYAQTMNTTVSNINYMLADVFADSGLAYIEETVGGLGVPAFGFGQYHNNFFAPSNFNAAPGAINIKPMTQKYIFTFSLSNNFKTALMEYLPRGSGVQTIIQSE
jgi:hypothetical protein